MKVKVTKGVVHDGEAIHKIGDTLDIADEDEAKGLIASGVVEAVDGGKAKKKKSGNDDRSIDVIAEETTTEEERKPKDNGIPQD